MKDINFFSVYRQKNTSVKQQLIRVGMAAGVFIFIVAAVYMAMVFRLNAIRSESGNIAAQLASPEIKQTLQTTKTYNDNLKALDNYELNTKAVESYLLAGKILGTSAFNTLSAQIPSGAVMQSFDYNNGSIVMEFAVSDITLSAQLDDILHSLNIFSSISTTETVLDRNKNIYITSFDAVLTDNAGLPSEAAYSITNGGTPQ